MKIVTPISPRVAKELDTWVATMSDLVEIDRNVAQYADFSGATSISVDVSRIVGGTMTGLSLEKLEMADVVAVKLEAAALQAYKARILRVEVIDSRLTGAEFAEGRFVDCVFRNVKLDDIGFRFAMFKRVRFENCMLRQADFSNATFEQVSFTGCDLEGSNFVSADCKVVDITTEDLTKIKGILGLKGATISAEQLMQLAPLLAQELGFRVEDMTASV